MKAIRLSRFGGPEVLELVDLPMPVPGRGEVLVRIRAAGINFFEALMRQDHYAVTPELPMVFGVEVAGVVEALGEEVAVPAIGTRVAAPLFAMGRSGGYAEYVAADAASVVPLPNGLSFENATALMVQGLTALHLIRRSPPKAKTVLVTAAAGGVGSLLIQMAKAAGARLVVAAAGSPEKLKLARALGADVAADYTEPGWTGRVRDATGGHGVDIAYDFVGGPVTQACLDALAPKGELVFGALNRFTLTPAGVAGMFFENQLLRGFALLPLLTPAGLRADLASLFNQAIDGKLKVTQGGRYPLDQAAEAHRAVENRQTVGKVVLIP